MARENRVARGLPGVKISENGLGITTSSTDSDREFENEYVQAFLDKREIRQCEGTFQLDQTAFRKYTSFLSISPTDVGYKDVEDFADFLGLDDHPGTTINTYVASIKAFHTFLNKRYQMNMPSLDGIKGSNHAQVQSHKREAIARETIRAVIDAAKSIRLAIILGLLYYSGCRRGEIPNFKTSDIDTEEKRVQIVNSKFGKSRNVPLHENLCWLLKVWLESERETYLPARQSDYLIVTERTEQISSEWVYELVMQTAEEAEVQEVVGTRADGSNIYKVKPHILRHSVATHAAKDGMPLENLQTFLGHSEISTTRRYTGDSEDRADKAYRSNFQGL